MTAAHQSASRVVAAFAHTTPIGARARLTWGPTVVVEVDVTESLTVFVKASSEQDVHLEAEVIGHARRAGLPAPEVLGTGTDPELPGGKWMITRAAEGVSLDRIGMRSPTTQRTLTELAELYASLHDTLVPGYGPLDATARHGTYASWSQWQQAGMERALTSLEQTGAVTAAFCQQMRSVSADLASTLDEEPGSLLHADLGDGETFVDPESGAVTGVVDWGSALSGDPLYDLARFVSGGPADDPRPSLAFPVLHAHYLERADVDAERARRLLRFYRLHICVEEAVWGEDLGWTPSLLGWAERLLSSSRADLPGGRL